MTDERFPDGVLRLLRLIGDRLESYLDGDETALETLGESIEQGDFSADDLQAAVMVLRSLAVGRPDEGSELIEVAAGKHALRVPSAEERERVSPEAWGYLLGLKRRGSLDAEQFERVLDLLAGSGERPVGVEMARETAARVALEFDQTQGPGDMPHGDFELAH